MENIWDQENTCLQKKCVFLKNTQKNQICLHSNLIFTNIEHKILGNTQFFFYVDSV